MKEEASEESISRFRKRDKALFYGRKMLRKVKNISGQGKKRKMMMKLARKILHLKKESDAEQLKVGAFTKFEPVVVEFSSVQCHVTFFLR